MYMYSYSIMTCLFVSTVCSTSHTWHSTKAKERYNYINYHYVYNCTNCKILYHSLALLYNIMLTDANSFEISRRKRASFGQVLEAAAVGYLEGGIVGGVVGAISCLFSCDGESLFLILFDNASNS